MKKNNRQFTAPISKAMEAYAGDGALAFHTPGHKQGLGAHPLLKRLITGAGGSSAAKTAYYRGGTSSGGFSYGGAG